MYITSTPPLLSLILPALLHLPLSSPSPPPFAPPASALSPPSSLPLSTTYDSIRRTLAIYAFAVDTRSAPLFVDRVFTSNATARYDGLGTLTGASTIANTLKQALEPVNTQHQLTTQVIDVHVDSESGTGAPPVAANATTYFQASHFGKGAYAGQVYWTFGRYEDSLVWVGGSGDSGGIDGWRIQQKIETDIVSGLFTIAPFLSTFWISTGSALSIGFVFALKTPLNESGILILSDSTPILFSES